MTVADRIKIRREELHISQEDLASRLGLKDKSSISKIEAAGDKISLKNIEKIALALHCTVQYLMGWDNANTGQASKDNSPYDYIDLETKTLIELYQNATPEMRKAALAVLKSGQQQDEQPE